MNAAEESSSPIFIKSSHIFETNRIWFYDFVILINNNEPFTTKKKLEYHCINNDLLVVGDFFFRNT